MKLLDLARIPRNAPFWVLLIAATLFSLVLLVNSLLPAVMQTLSGEVIATSWIAGTMLVLYIALLALPFVPGAEVGLALLIVSGGRMAIPVYLATIVALSISYWAGHAASKGWMAGRYLVWSRSLESAAGILPLAGHQGTYGRLMRVRWIALIFLINTPGNSVIGGGGGIAFMAGYSRAFPFLGFLASIAAAVAPVPAAVLLANYLNANDWLIWFIDIAAQEFEPRMDP